MYIYEVIMNISVSKWGNSLGIRIPKAITEELQLREGSTVALIATADGYMLRPAQPAVSYLLADLLGAMRDEPEPEELDWGPDVGEESE